MKKNVEKIEKVVVEEKVTYIAYDGTEFQDEDTCKEYEKSYACVIKSTFNAMNKVEIEPCTIGLPYDNEDYTTLIVVPKTEQEIVVLKTLADRLSYTNLDVNLNLIGKKILLHFGYGFDRSPLDADFMDIYLFENHMNSVKKAWADALAKADEF